VVPEKADYEVTTFMEESFEKPIDVSMVEKFPSF
jgi:hypothetical protein